MTSAGAGATQAHSASVTRVMYNANFAEAISADHAGTISVWWVQRQAGGGGGGGLGVGGLVASGGDGTAGLSGRSCTWIPLLQQCKSAAVDCGRLVFPLPVRITLLTLRHLSPAPCHFGYFTPPHPNPTQPFLTPTQPRRHVPSGKLRYRFLRCHGDKRITALAFDAAKRRLVSGAEDGDCKVCERVCVCVRGGRQRWRVGRGGAGGCGERKHQVGASGWRGTQEKGQ